MREALTKKKKYKLPGEIVRVEDVKTDQGTIKAPVSIEKPKRSGKETAKNIIKKYDKIRREKKFKKIVETNDKKKKNEHISILEEIKNANVKKNTKITAQKNLKKYKRMKIPKKTYLIDEKDVERINYNDPQEDLFESESIVKAANKVLNYEAFKRDQEKLLKNSSKKSKKSAQITAKKISQNIKT